MAADKLPHYYCNIIQCGHGSIFIAYVLHFALFNSIPHDSIGFTLYSQLNKKKPRSIALLGWRSSKFNSLAH